MARASAFAHQISDQSIASEIILNKAKFVQFLEALHSKIGQETDDLDVYMSKLGLFYRIPVYSTFKPFVMCYSQYEKHALSSGQHSLNNTVTFDINAHGTHVADMHLHVKMSSFSANSGTDRVRWAAYPGHRLCKVTTLKAGTHTLDTYYTEDYTAKLAFLPVGQRIAWKRSVGQQIAYKGILTPDPVSDMTSEERRFYIGAQTFKDVQPELDMWVPTMFWFNDPKHALPICMMNKQEVSVHFEFAALGDLIAYSDLGGGGGYSTPKMLACELYVNHIYIPQELREVYIRTSTRTWIRVHRHHKSVLTGSNGAIHLKDLRWLLERCYFAFRPTENLDHTQEWYKVCKLTSHSVAASVLTEVTNPSPPPATLPQLAGNYSIFYAESPSVDKLSVQLHGNHMANDFPEHMLGPSSLLRRSNMDIDSPESLGWYVINFNMEPSQLAGAWQDPSGFFDASIGREMFISYESSYITPSTQAHFILCGQCLNILEIEGGEAKLLLTT